MSKKDLSERDICTKYITPAIVSAGWDVHTQVRENVHLTAGRVIVRGRMTVRGKAKFADYVLYYKPNVPLAIIEAKDNNHGVGDGMQQGLGYAEMLDVPFVLSSNGDGFLLHDRTGQSAKVETALPLDEFPSPEELWQRYCAWRSLSEAAAPIVAQDYYSDGSGKSPRYYQINAVNRVVEAVARGQNRILLVMATGTGKTYTAFQIIWRLWKAGQKKRILFLADRNILVDQTKTNDFKPFGGAMTKITNRKVDKSFEIYLALYQAISGAEEEKDLFRQFSPDFFDLIVVDECHRGSASDNSAWRDVLEYFSGATQLGLTATPKETTDVSTTTYFGDAAYTYSLKQGIEDGFLAPYKVVRIDLDKDVGGWRPEKGKTDKLGQEIEDRVYNQRDFDRTLVLEKRTELVATKLSEFLAATNRFDKTIVFCEDIDHAERMREALVNANADLATQNRKYVMRITGDNAEGKAELDNFIHPEQRYPVIATTSKLMTTGVDCKTCKVIVLDQTIRSMTEFKQIIGRGTRVRDDYGKLFFSILDYTGSATRMFADPDFDGDPTIETEQTIDETGEPTSDETVVTPEEEPDGGEGPTDLPPDFDDGPRRKFYVDGGQVEVAAHLVYELDPDGNQLRVVQFTDYTADKVRMLYRNAAELRGQWADPDKRREIIDRLEERGIDFDHLAETADQPDADPLDLLCHLAFNAPLRTRRERAQRLRAERPDFFDQYGPEATEILNEMLDKYTEHGTAQFVVPDVLELPPINEHGNVIEIAAKFGDAVRLREAVNQLQTLLYAAA